ncbi:MAG: YabP/YqfC family sporulation protein [Firmicutes bacterium]|nr:YabP/YqfC family sporulation protein [Bacillota bacterium]
MNKELLQDLDLRIPKILVHGNRGMIDNVKTIELLSEETVVVSCGKQSISVHGSQLTITYLEGERMVFEGNIELVEFFGKKDLHE